MSTSKNIGIVSVVPMGTWTASTSYKKLNIVEYENVTYIVTQACKGVVPGVTSGWSNYYMQILTSAEAIEAAEKSEAAMQVAVEAADLIDEVLASEDARATAEANRAKAETARVDAEIARVAEYNALVEKIDAAAEGVDEVLAAEETAKELYSKLNAVWYVDDDGDLHLLTDTTVE